MNYEQIVESFMVGKISNDETLLRLDKLGLDSLLDFFWRVDSTIFKNMEFKSNDGSGKAFELGYLIALKNAETSRSEILCFKFNNFLNSEHISQNIRHYGLFVPSNGSHLIDLNKELKTKLPIIDLDLTFPEILTIEKGKRDLLINLHQLSIFNRSALQKKSLTLVGQVLAVSEEDFSISIEIDFCFNQLVANIDNHWHQTTLFCYLELVEFAMRSGHSITPMFKHLFSPSPTTSPSKFYITQHTISPPQLNRIHFKNSHLSGYIHFDKIGYAGFSSLATPNFEMQISEDADVKDHISMVRNRYDDATLAKHPQNPIGFDIGKHLSSYRRIILFTMQLPFDSVQRLAYIGTRDLLRALCECVDSDELLLVKRHPYDDTMETKLLLDSLISYKNVIVTEANIYSLFEVSNLLVTVNSGTGFEAAIYGLDVITAGITDYTPATILVKNMEELRKALRVDEFPSAIERDSYLYSYLKKNVLHVRRPNVEGKIFFKSISIDFVMSELLKNTYSTNSGVVIPGQIDLLREALTYDFQSILDIGAGNLAATNFFKAAGKKCAATINNVELYSPSIPKDVKIYRDINVENLPFMMGNFDAVWCAHVLEHTLNPGKALLSIRKKIRCNGMLFLMVPPFKHSVVGGHLSVGWNLGILMYFLIVCGFDVKNGSFIRHGYNLAAFVRKGEFPSVRLNYDAGDIELLSDYFPSSINASQGFDGNLSSVSWEWKSGDSCIAHD